MKSFIKGYKVGANISLLNTLYHRSTKDPITGRYGTDSIDIIYKDLNTGEKKLEHIESPKYTYYKTKDGIDTNYNRLFIDAKDVEPIECEYKDLKKNIAKTLDMLDFFYDNLKSGNAQANDALLRDPSIFMADMHIEDYYRYLFDCTYQNTVYNPTKLYFDIETDNTSINGAFPEPGQCPVNIITIVDEHSKRVHSLMLDDDKNPQLTEFKNTPNIKADLKNFIRERVGGWKEEHRYGLDQFEYNLAWYNDEIMLIHDAFSIINMIKPDFAIAWNIAFDLPYLIARIQKLGYDPTDIICHPDFPVKECYYYIDHRASKFEERGDYAGVSCYTVYIDQLITFASRRKGQRQVPSFKLDYIGDRFAHVRKLDYSNITDDISRLPYLNYRVFVFYNIMDTIVQLCVENKVADIDFVFTKAMTTCTRFAKVHRQTTYLVNRGIMDFGKMGYVMGDNCNKSNVKTGFAGAFVADPNKVTDKPKMKINDRPVLICDNCVDYDFSAMYPNTIYQNNMAPNTQLGKIILEEQLDDKENRFNNDYFDRAVWFVEDLMSGDALNFCKRYLHLPDYQEMYEYIQWYFNNIECYGRPILSEDSKTGLREMCTIVPEAFRGQKRIMCRIIDNTKPRIMCYSVERMPKYDPNHHS